VVANRGVDAPTRLAKLLDLEMEDG
jgi:hypothetical protein